MKLPKRGQNCHCSVAQVGCTCIALGDRASAWDVFLFFPTDDFSNIFLLFEMSVAGEKGTATNCTESLFILVELTFCQNLASNAPALETNKSTERLHQPSIACTTTLWLTTRITTGFLFMNGIVCVRVNGWRKSSCHNGSGSS